MFSSMKKHVVNQARKTRFGLYTRIRNLDLSIACQLKLFHNLVVPILTYGCGVWGFGDLSGIDKVHTDFKTNSQSKTKHAICNAIWRLRLCTIINKY